MKTCSGDEVNEYICKNTTDIVDCSSCGLSVCGVHQRECYICESVRCGTCIGYYGKYCVCHDCFTDPICKGITAYGSGYAGLTLKDFLARAKII